MSRISMEITVSIESGDDAAISDLMERFGKTETTETLEARLRSSVRENWTFESDSSVDAKVRVLQMP